MEVDIFLIPSLIWLAQDQGSGQILVKSTSSSEYESSLRAEPEYRAEGFFLLTGEAKFHKHVHAWTFLCACLCVPVCLVVKDLSTKSWGQVVVSFRRQRHRDHQASHRFTQVLGIGKKCTKL